MTNPFVYKGRLINKILCLSFLGMTLVLLGTGGILSLQEKTEAAETFGILALITGGFSLIYGVLWFVWARKESKADRILRAALGPESAAQDSAPPVWREFRLPGEQLRKTAYRRFSALVRWIILAAFCTGALIEIIIFACGTRKSFPQMLYTVLFCVLIAIPGIFIQWRIYRQYVRSVPEKIQLYQGRLAVDDVFFSSGEILEIKVSSEQLFNLNSPAVFRKLLIRTETGSTAYCIDSRSGRSSSDQPFWPEYGALLAALSEWGSENSVTVNITFMD